MKRPIAVFDSGVGGLTVFRSISRLLPKENLIYLADTKRSPYGDLSKETLVQCSEEVVAFLGALGVKMVVFGCHTVSSRCLGSIFPIPVIGMVQATLRCFRGSRVAVLGTTRTIESGVYQAYPCVKIFPVACPLLVPLIEQGLDVETALRKYLEPLEVDAIVLACTHYPLIRKEIQKIVGENVFLCDPADLVAQEVQMDLKQRDLLNDETKPYHRFYVTEAPEVFARKALHFLGESIAPNLIEINSSAQYILEGSI